MLDFTSIDSIYKGELLGFMEVGFLKNGEE